MENKNFFDAWQETQKQLMDNWTESNRKLQDSVKTGAAATDGFTIYQEWLNKQAEITKKATEQASETAKTTFDKASEQFKGNANLGEVYGNWMKSQQETAAKAFENFKSFTPPSFNGFNGFNANPADFTKQWMDTSKNMFEQYTKNFAQPASFGDWTKHFTNDTTRDAWKNFTEANNGFFRFFEMWKPAFDAAQNNQFNAEWFKNSFNPSAFSEMMNKTLDQISPTQMRELFSQYQNWSEMAVNYNKNAYNQWANGLPENVRNSTPFTFWNNLQENSNNNPFTAYQKSVMPVFSFFNPGKEGEVQELVVTVLEKTSTYGQKLNEMQKLLYVNGAKLWENFVTENAEKIRKGTDLSNTQDVFQKWVAYCEESFIGIFRGDEYSKIQAELLDLSLEIRQKNEKIQEIALGNTPVVLRSEADELYETIYELRKRVYALEKQLNADAPETKESKPSKKKATA
ncbi:MAG TPA: poly(R)-hydroxyalkanoic acid synthase subunit PhaE [Bacteroidia bacterium]|nr:poly(R)-hydroxyalkanoic acid synthase subunit PhaE [Bacteroidia bacterium]